MLARNTSIVQLLAFAAPGFGLGLTFMVLGVYLMKFSTDVLLVPASVIGLISGAARVWDAVVDPAVGILSDRTSNRIGRRRIWMLLSAVPLCATFFMAFAPPPSLEGVPLIMWLCVAVFGYYTSMSALMVPHMTLASELTADAKTRTQLFGARQIAQTIGYVAGLAAITMLTAGGQVNNIAARQAGAEVGIIVAIISALTILIGAAILIDPNKKRAETRNLPLKSSQLFHPAIRPLYAAAFLENLGYATVGVLTYYVAQYVIGDINVALLALFAYLACSLLTMPLWIKISAHVSKRTLWICSMLASACVFAAMVTIGHGTALRFVALVAAAGAANGCGSLMAPALIGEAIALPSLRQSPAGGFYGTFNFFVKSALGVSPLIAGLALGASGFLPNAQQTPKVVHTLIYLFSLYPCATYLCGALILCWPHLRARLRSRADFDRTRKAIEQDRV